MYLFYKMAANHFMKENMMPRLRFSLSSMCIALVVPIIGHAQSQAPPIIPHTPAGEVLRGYIAINATATLDTARLRRWVQRYRPGVAVDMTLERTFSERTGGFELMTIERSEPRHIEYTTRERNGGMAGYGLIEVSEGPTPVVTTFRGVAIGVNGNAELVRIDAPTRSRIIASVATALDSAYVFPDVATRMNDTIRVRLARGEYDRETSGFAFALRLTNDLIDVSHDKHLGVDYRVAGFPPSSAGPGSASTPARPSPSPTRAPSPVPSPSAARQGPSSRPLIDARRCGFDKVGVLDNGVGYLKLNGFADLTGCEPDAMAAMDSLATARSLIIDLRHNNGGSPQMISYIASYLFDERTHLNDLWERPSGRTVEFWTRDSVPGRRFGGKKPIYVLTSSRTFSGGEEFTYDLQVLKRAVVVGERTRGGAHLTAPKRIDYHFTLSVPFARAINPVTHTNWEGVGVAPDVEVTAADALQVALARLTGG
jgi:retinol-binding protein 3